MYTFERVVGKKGPDCLSSVCINDIVSSSCLVPGNSRKEKDEKEDEKSQIQSGTARGAEGK